MRIATDWHMHTRHSCDCRLDGMGVDMAGVASLVSDGKMAACGIADHIHTSYNLPDIEASRAEFDSLPFVADFHFGVEVSCVSQWELDRVAAGEWVPNPYGIRSGGPQGGALAIALTEKDIARLRVEYVVGGAHWPMYVPQDREAIIRDYHRQNMFLAAHPLVDIVAHPWWWMGYWATPEGNYPTDPWFDDFGKVPLAMHDEFAACVREHGTAVEINLSAMLCNRRYPEAFRPEYLDYIAYLAERGVTLSVGSDAHGGDIRKHHAEAEAYLAGIGLREADCWRLPPRSAHGTE